LEARVFGEEVVEVVGGIVRVLRTFALTVRILRTTISSDTEYEEQRMRVISKARLKQFWKLPGHEDAEGSLRAWYTHINSKTVSWQAWADVKASFASASIVGDCTVFNIGGNKYRLISRVRYSTQKVFILKMMTHGEYDEDKWKGECGCFEPPQPPKRKKTAPAKRPTKGKQP
jgi:mRNA interferase HigB